jgi:hypothetical protein
MKCKHQAIKKTNKKHLYPKPVPSIEDKKKTKWNFNFSIETQKNNYFRKIESYNK